MTIEKIEYPERLIYPDVSFLADKINELIDFINTREQDRSEQMARTIENIAKLNNRIVELENATNPKDEELILGCPWCNDLPHVSEGYSILLSYPPKFNYIIQCINKKCRVNPKLAFSFNNMQEAIKAWNTRG